MAQQPTFSLEELQKLIAEGVAAAMATEKITKKARGKPGAKPKTDEEKAKARAKTDVEAVKVFEKAGYKDVQPRVNVRTYQKWLEAGRRVRKGEKSTKVGSFPLFHIDQTDEIKAEGTVH